MFSSSGYFRGVNCPYFASGLCDRAYCHFRHSKPPEERPKENLASYSAKTGPSYSFNSSQISGYSASPYLRKSVAGYIDNYSSNESPNQSSSQESCINKDSNSCSIPSFSESSSTLPQSAPEPEIDRQSLPKISGLAKRKFSSPPSYNPTPKNLTTDLEIDSQDSSDVPSYHPTPKIISGSVNGKSAPGKKSVIQYDPVKNYAVNPKQYSSASDDEHEPNVTSHESEFSADEEENESSELVKNNDFHGEIESENHDKHESKRPSVTNYADLLTPSSYFTNKLSSLSSSSKAADGSSDDHDLSSATRENGCIDKQSSSHSAKNHKSSDSKSTRHSSSTAASKSKSKSSSHRESGTSSTEHKGSKSHSISSSSTSRSSSSSKSSSSSSSRPSSSSKSSSSSSSRPSSSSKSSSSSSRPSSSSKSSSSSSRPSSSSKSSSSSSKSKSSSNLPQDVHGSKHSKHSSSESIRKSGHHSEEHKTHSTSKKDKSSSSSDSKTTHTSHRRSRSSSSDSKHSVTNLSKYDSGDKEASHHESDHKKHGSKTNNSSTTSQSSSSSHLSQELKRSMSGSELKTPSCHKTICRSTSSAEKVKKSHNDVTEVKEERSSLDMNNSHSERDKRKANHNDSNKIKSNDKERRRSHDLKREKVKSEIELDKKTKRSKSAQERHFSDITSDLFGEESDGSDSDVQIVEPPPQPPPEILELTDSDEEKYGGDEFLTEEDLNFSDTDTFDECLRIFQETDRKLKLQKRSAPLDALQEDESSNKSDFDNGHAVPGKKRMAHPSAQQVVRFKPPVSKPRLGPAEVMHNRIVEMQKRALMRAAKREGREADLPRILKSNSNTSNVTASASHHRTSVTGSHSSGRSIGQADMATSASSLTSNQKKREAHLPSTPTKTVPSVNSQSSVWSPNSFYTKKKSHGTGNTNTSTSESSKTVTIAGTASRTEKRKAHVPTSVNLKRPLIAAGDSSKVPVNVRQRYLNLIIDEFLKFCQEETAFQKGQEEEQEVYKRATNKNIYLRVAVNAIKRIRTEAAQSQPSSSKKARLDNSAMASRGSSAMLQSHEATLGGSRAAKTSFTLNRSGPQRIQTEFKGVELYNRLKKYVMTEEQLRENSYPRPSEDGRSIAKYYTTKVQDSLLKDNERLCRRCGKRYYIQEDGTPVTQQECIYHYANMYKKKVAGSLDSRYGCCNERAGVKGCQVANTHVNEVNKYENITGYMKTLSSSESDPKNTKVLSLDCEMVYTKAGMELARVTVIGDECQVLYETFVKPDTDIIDYNTRFSGITAKDMKGVETTLRGVQAVMLSMITDQTILIGHSLESDLTALKMIHSTVVDTSIVFPHRLGLPYKRALRNLMVDHLQKIIQTDDGGHDSKEDAISCMQLMIYKIKQDAKSECRRF